jgi:hypothetical protein
MATNTSKIGDRSRVEGFLMPPSSSRFPRSHERSRKLQAVPIPVGFVTCSADLGQHKRLSLGVVSILTSAVVVMCQNPDTPFSHILSQATPQVCLITTGKPRLILTSLSVGF